VSRPINANMNNEEYSLLSGREGRLSQCGRVAVHLLVRGRNPLGELVRTSSKLVGNPGCELVSN